MKEFSRRKTFAAIIGAPILAALPQTLSASVETVTGPLIDLGCYENGRPAREYTGIHARACALEGFFEGVLASDGKVYQIVGSYTENANAKLLPFYMTRAVTVTGEVGQKDGRMTIAATEVKPVTR